MTGTRLWDYQLNLQSLANTASNSGIKVDWNSNGVLSDLTFDPTHSGSFGGTPDLQSFRIIVDDAGGGSYDTSNVSASENGFDFNYDFYKRRTTEMILKNGATNTPYIATLYTEFMNDSDILYLYPRLHVTAASHLNDVKYELKFPLSYDTLYGNLLQGAALPTDPHAGWTNLVGNGSFERAITGTWNTAGNTQINATTGGYTQYNGADLVYTQGQSGSYLQWVWGASTVGRTYSVTARIKSKPGTGTKSVTMSIAGAGSASTTVNDQTWTQVSASAYASTTGFNSVRISTGTSGDVLYVDDIQETSSHSYIVPDTSGSYTVTGTTGTVGVVTGGGINGHDAVEYTCSGSNFHTDFTNGYVITPSIGAPVVGRTYVLTAHLKSTLSTGSDSQIEILGQTGTGAYPAGPLGSTGTWTPSNLGFETYTWTWVGNTTSGFVQGRIHGRPSQPLLICDTEIDDYDYTTLTPTSSTWTLSTGSTGAITHSSTALYGSNAAFFYAGSGGTANNISSTSFGSSTTGQYYTASAWVKMAPGQTNGTVQISVNGHNWSTAATIPDEFTWVRVSTIAQATDGTFNNVALSGSSGATFIIDGVQLEQHAVSTPPTYFEDIHDPNTVAISGRNLLYSLSSASFEEASGATQGWVSVGGSAASGYASDGVFGTQSMEISNSTGTTSTSSYTQAQFNAVQGRTYNVAVHMKALSGSPTLRIWVESPTIIGSDSQNGYNNYEEHAPCTASGWKILNFRYTALDGGTQTLKLSTSSSSGMLVDGVMVSEEEGLVYEDSVQKNNCAILYDSTNHKGIVLYLPFSAAENRLWSIDRYQVRPRLDVTLAKTTDSRNTILTYTIHTDSNAYTVNNTLDLNLFLKPFSETLATGNVVQNLYSFGYTPLDTPSSYGVSTTGAQVPVTRFNPIEGYSGFIYGYFTPQLILQVQQNIEREASYRVDSYRDMGHGPISYLWHDELKRCVVNTIDKAQDAKVGGTWTSNGNLTGGTRTPSGIVSYKFLLSGSIEQHAVQSGNALNFYNSFFFGQMAEYAFHCFAQLAYDPSLSSADKTAIMTAADNARNVFDPSGPFNGYNYVNSCRNGDFETDLSGWNTRGGSATISRTNATSDLGSYSMLVAGTDSGSNNAYYTFTPEFHYADFNYPYPSAFTYDPAYAYTAYLYAKAVSGSPTVTLSFAGVGGSPVTLNASTWTRVAVTLAPFVASDNEIRINSSSGAQFYVDKVMIEQTGSPIDSRFSEYYTENGAWFNYLPIYGGNALIVNAQTSMINSAKELKAIADAVGDGAKSAYWGQMVQNGLDGAYWFFTLHDGWSYNRNRTDLTGHTTPESDGIAYYTDGYSLHNYQDVVEGSLLNVYRTNTYLSSNLQSVLAIGLTHDLNHDLQASYAPSDVSQFSQEMGFPLYAAEFDNPFLATVNTNYNTVQPTGRTRLIRDANVDPQSFYYLTTDQDIHTLWNGYSWYDTEITKDQIAMENESGTSRNVTVKIYDKVAGDGHDLAQLTGATELVTNTGLTLNSGSGYDYVTVTVPAHSLRIVKISYN